MIPFIEVWYLNHVYKPDFRLQSGWAKLRHSFDPPSLAFRSQLMIFEPIICAESRSIKFSHITTYELTYGAVVAAAGRATVAGSRGSAATVVVHLEGYE